MAISANPSTNPVRADAKSVDLRWLWLLIGFALLPFTAYRDVIPLAAWIAPVFLLRFERVSRGQRSLWLIATRSWHASTGGNPGAVESRPPAVLLVSRSTAASESAARCNPLAQAGASGHQ